MFVCLSDRLVFSVVVVWCNDNGSGSSGSGRSDRNGVIFGVPVTITTVMVTDDSTKNFAAFLKNCEQMYNMKRGGFITLYQYWHWTFTWKFWLVRLYATFLLTSN